MTAGPAIATPEARARLESFLARAASAAGARVTGLHKLGGGAIQQNWALDVELTGGQWPGRRALVLRTDAPSIVAASHDRRAEFALLQAAFAAGVAVPEPIAFCDDTAVIGQPFSVMARIGGTAAGHIIVRDDKWRGDRRALLERLGDELARIHDIRPPRPDLAFLPQPETAPALAAVAQYRAWLDALGEARPALEWGLRWLEIQAPPAGEVVLCHRDFRTGNYMADEAGLTGILDWEFAGWGDPMEDIGWFCAKCWRFVMTAREAGGIGDRTVFYRAYSRRSGRAIDPDAVRYWEAMAHARWAVIALQQGARHVSGKEPSLDLALTGRRAAELELELLRMTAPPAEGEA